MRTAGQSSKAAVCVRRLSDRFIDSAAGCTRLSELAGLVADTAAELGFHFYALVDHASLGEPSANFVRIDNYPAEWALELKELAAGVDDPVHLASRRTNAGFCWHAVPALVSLDCRHREILKRSRAFGLGSGFTVPANVPGEPAASCSFAVRTGVELPVTRLRCAELIGTHALSAARRLRPVEARSPRPRLSRREVQCLKLLAQGKTDWEMAMILGISVETVHQYVKRARAAYDVVSRTQLVVHALRDDWIRFEEVIPAATRRPT